MISPANHTIGRLKFRFVGNTDVLKFQELLGYAWNVTVLSSKLSPLPGFPDSKDWDTRVKVTTYPTDLKGSTDIRQGDRVKPDPLHPQFEETLALPYVARRRVHTALRRMQAHRRHVNYRYEPPMDTNADLVYCVGLKVQNQNLAMPNDVLGRCVVMLPLPDLVNGKVMDVEQALTLGSSADCVGTIKYRLAKEEDVDPDEGAQKLNHTLVRVAGGLSTLFHESRLQKKLDREEDQEKHVRRLIDQVASGNLDLEDFFRRHGTGGGEGVCVCVCVCV